MDKEIKTAGENVSPAFMGRRERMFLPLLQYNKSATLYALRSGVKNGT